MEIAIHLELDPHNDTYLPDNHRWVGFLESIGQEMHCEEEAEVCLTFTDDDTIKNLNAQYRDIDRPTDVLSFPQDMENNILGDIIVSVEKAKVQAEEKGHDLEQELALLVAHGFLHLLGYDHAEPEEEQRMFSLQDRLLQHYYNECFGKELV